MRHRDREHYQGYCRDCGQYVWTKTEDVGVGNIEVHGRMISDHDYREVCPVCGGRVDPDAGLPCHVCRNYDIHEWPPDGCKIDLLHGGFKTPETMDTGDECKFFEEID